MRRRLVQFPKRQSSSYPTLLWPKIFKKVLSPPIFFGCFLVLLLISGKIGNFLRQNPELDNDTGVSESNYSKNSAVKDLETTEKELVLTNDVLSEQTRYVEKPPPPGIAWLVSYPNSGTSYTLAIVKAASNYTIATNYGKESSKYLQEVSIPIHPSYINGPYFTNDREREIPRKFVLTKTHCGGRCVRCGPSKYIETEESFLRECLSTTPIIRQNNTSSFILSDPIFYDKSLVRKAIHIMRNPFDNVVSRFHHAHKIHVNDEQFKSNFPRNDTGFKLWCADMDTKYSEEEASTWNNAELIKAARHVPCRSEFYRYVQWHNLCFAILERHLKIPSLFVTYEDYGINLKDSLSKILDFLELPLRDTMPDFHQGNYEKHFSANDRLAAMHMMKIQASKTTWAKMKSYREEIGYL